MLYVQQSSSLHHLSELRTQAATGLPSAPEAPAGKQGSQNRGLCYIPVKKNLKVQRKVGLCSGVINKLTQEGRHQDMSSVAP